MEFVNSYGSGAFSSEVGAHFTAAKLIPLRKKAEGVRPIAIGEIFRRLVGKCLLSKVSENVICKLQPIQMGVGIRGACELINIATRVAIFRS